jgi:hypothetical protein
VNRVTLACLAITLVRCQVFAEERPGVADWAVESLPAVVAPPERVFERFRDGDREVARGFYKKYIDVKGLAVVASQDVADEALQRTYWIVTHMLAGRPDILGAMRKAGTRLIIIGKDQVYTDMPEYRNHPNPEYQNERVRGTGGLGVTSFGEENLLTLAGDRYDDESIGVHEFCHTIDAALCTIDPTWRDRLNKTYRGAMEKGLWKYAYTASNPAEYWAEICQSYFDCNRINNWNHNAVGTREQLKQYDPEGYELVRTTFKLTPENDWRYRPMRPQPSVVAPPAKMKADPYYAKLTYAREFPVLGSKRVSDRAMLKANDTIRKMFAYRHDLLKAMIADGARLVVLGRGERVSDLPEFKDAKEQVAFDGARFVDYSTEKKLIVVPEENVLALPDDPVAGASLVVSAMSKAFYRVTGSRPVDPEFDRRRQKQQYELRVKRLDVEFDQRVQTAYRAATEKGLWKGTPAARDPFEYWAAGVAAYFDAAGAGFAPHDADRPITTREALKAYDPDLYAIVDETMAYREHQDWRYKADRPVTDVCARHARPAIRRLSNGVSRSTSNPAATDEITKSRKKSAWPPSLNQRYQKRLTCPVSIFSIWPAIWPPSLFASALERNQMPMRNETYRAGAARVTNESPVGEMQSSPSVCSVYVAISQNMPARCAGDVPIDPTTMKMYPPPRRSSASATFTGMLGFRLRRPSADQIAAKTGASRMISSGPTDWNQVAGISHEPIRRSVISAAKRLRLLPACSNASQKTALKTMKIRIAAVGPRSAGSCFMTKRTNQTIRAPMRSQRRMMAIAWPAVVAVRRSTRAPRLANAL